MSVKLPEKQQDPKEEKTGDEVENLPPEDQSTEEAAPQEPENKISDADKARELELQLAEARGKLSMVDSKKPEATPAPTMSSEEQQYYNAKNVVMQDASNLDDDAFKNKYNMDKASVRLHYLEYERNMDRQKNAEQLAKMSAENEILAKYGKDFAKYRSDVTEAINEASPEVRRDAMRLAKFMERTFLALSRDEKPDTPVVTRTSKKETKAGEPVRRITNDFDAPSENPIEKNKGKKEENDELEGEDLEVGRHFGIFTKSEREKYSGRYLEMNFGNGVVFKDPKRGFEKVVKK